MITLYEGDNRVQLKRLISRGVLVDSVCCDPPYHLTSMVKRFGGKGAAPANYASDGSFARLSSGFMEETWDGADENGIAIAQDPEFWSLVYQVMKPGAYLVAFSSSRTYHRMACAIEDAGFVTHPMIGWTFAQGFAKAHSAARAIDKALGAEGTVDRFTKKYVPTTPEAQKWDGWHYGGQARKPALEPIYVGQKPFSEPNGGLNILVHGVGAVNIEDCRVRNFVLTSEDANKVGDVVGRWPANLVHDGSDEVVALFPESKGALADVRGTEPSRTGDANTVCYGEYGRVPSKRRGDTSGSAARFFSAFPFEDRPIFHYPKADKADRAGSKHPTVKPILLMRDLIRHVTPPGGTVLDPFAGSGTTAAAALLENNRCILMEKVDEYVAFLQHRFDLKPTVYNFSLIDSIDEKSASGGETPSKVEFSKTPGSDAGADLIELLS